MKTIFEKLTDAAPVAHSDKPMTAHEIATC